MNNKQPNKKSNYQYTGVFLILGTAAGTSLSISITGNPIWGIVGTAVGIIIGAIIDSYKMKK